MPSQDIVLGLYYLSIARDGQPGEGMVFGSIEEVDHALHAGVVNLHSKIKARIEQIDENGNAVMMRFETTPGRLRLGQLLPKNFKTPFDIVNRLLRKKEVGEVIDTVYRHCGQKEIGDLLRPDHGPRLHRGVQGRHLVRQGRHGDPGRTSGIWSTRPATR